MIRSVSRSAIRRCVEPDVTAVGLKATTTYQYNYIRNYHNATKVQNELIVGGLAIGTAAISLQFALKAYSAMAEKRAQKGETPTEENTAKAEDTTTSTAAGSTSTTEPEQNTTNASDESPEETQKKAAEAAKKRAKANAANLDSWFGNWTTWFAKNFYDGGFEEKMTKREAALILGVRESANPERIKEAHRKIMQINHPDKGGSAYLTAKVNEAKDLLLKGK
jgi:hypothetical protein